MPEPEPKITARMKQRPSAAGGVNINIGSRFSGDSGGVMLFELRRLGAIEPRNSSCHRKSPHPRIDLFGIFRGLKSGGKFINVEFRGPKRMRAVERNERQPAAA